MKRCLPYVGSLSLVLVISAPAFGQDPVKADPQHYTVVLDNPSVRVLKVSYAPGSKSVTHSHPDAIFISLSASKARFTTPDGKFQDVDMAAESALYTPAGTHIPSNTGTTPVDGVLIEFKAPAAGKAMLPTSRPEMSMKLLAEGARASAFRVTATPAFAEPAGTKHDFDQVLIPLGAVPVSLTIDGQPAKTSWARGEVVFIARGVGHAAKATGSKGADMVIVGIK